VRLKSASVMGKLRLGQNASAGRTRHYADASDPPCLLHPGAGVRGARAAMRPRLGDRLPVPASPLVASVSSYSLWTATAALTSLQMVVVGLSVGQCTSLLTCSQR